MDCLAKPLYELKEFEDLMGAAKKRRTASSPQSIQLCGCVDTQKCHMIHAISQESPYRIIIAADERRAREIAEDYQFYDKNVMVYPPKDVIFYSADVHGHAIVKERIKVLKCLLEHQGGTIVTTLDAGMDRILPIHRLEGNVKRLKTGECVDLTELSKQLVLTGYEKCGQVSAQGEFAVRGGIIDIFPLTEETPVRIELWDDEIDTIRSFDVESQRSIEQLQEVVIYPATEFLMDEDIRVRGFKKMDQQKKSFVKVLKQQKKLEECRRIDKLVDQFREKLECYGSAIGIESYVNFFYPETVSFFDYFGDEAVFFLDEPRRIEERATAVSLEFSESMTTRLAGGYILPDQVDAVFSYEQVLATILQKQVFVFSMFDQKEKGFNIGEVFYFNVESLNSYHKDFALLLEDVRKWKKQKYRIILLSPFSSGIERLHKNFLDNDIMSSRLGNSDREILPGELVLVQGNLHRGFIYPMLKLVFLSENDIFGVQKKKQSRKKYDGDHLQSFNDLNVGDYVVHVNHGIGIYRGIEKIETDMITKDYVKIEYDKGGVLYVLATDLSDLQKYASSSAKKPKINSLNSLEWKKTKTKTKAAVRDIAEELVSLYAKRQHEKGFTFSKDTVWQTEFEEAFPFDETEDQLRAIEQTKEDMESAKIMDRLICGDVGFGKTEIAIRAAFKAVMDGRQVALLVPTTILAQQHYNTFSQRMKDYPMNVDMLSRFRTPAQQKKTIERLKKGEVDIVIGTHRLLSKDIQFSDLGLLIVDEEQRFGVTHKEKIKQLRANVDVLTLSATPIPRTLHMSLVGIRDMSVLEEPPVDRLPIQTYVMEHNDEIIREAISRELARGGQVYYVYNRVNGIEDVSARLQKMLPQANIAFGHGQMQQHQMERIMYDFINGEIDVLVATTIIETGLDISNVNTMIIDQADKLGLSQLYQLRGRIGRSNRTSFAFLMYRPNQMLREVAEKRLQAIKEFTDLGSGFKIAMRDLEIRGAGNLLGARQHGHMENVGYDMYCKMLNEAVRALKGEQEQKEEYETRIDLERDAYIPSTYIKSEYERLRVYKRIASLENKERFMDMQDELIDRFGQIPAQVEQLLWVALLRGQAHEAYVVNISQEKTGFFFEILPTAKIDTEKIAALVERYEGKLVPRVGTHPGFLWLCPTGKKEYRQQFEQMLKIIGEFEQLKIS